MKHVTSRLFRAVALIVGGFAFGTGNAHAAAINLLVPGAEYGGSPWTLGFEFTVASAFTVDSLGVYDSGQNGIANSGTVGIWLATGGSPLVSAVVPAGSSGELDNFFRYTDISPFVLAPGVSYVIGSYLADTASSFNTGQGGAGTVDPLVTIIRDRFVGSGNFSFPSFSNNHAGAWLGANFRGVAAPAAVPEPTSLLLLGSGAAALAARAKRRKSSKFVSPDRT